MEKEIALVYMLAGMSSRFGGKNKCLEIVGPNSETLLEYSLNQAISLGFSRIIFIVGNHNFKEFHEKFGDYYKNIPIKYFFQNYNKDLRDRPWGTGDALCSMKEIDCPFIVCSGDDIYGKENLEILFNHLKSSNDEATIGIKLKEMIPEKGKVNRGIFQTKNNFVIDIKETCAISIEDLKTRKLNPESFCSMSLFAIHPKTLELIKEKLKIFKEQNKHDRKIEFFLPEALADLIKENKIQMRLYPAKNKWFGITNIGDEIILKENLKNI
jgi:NDP-sugar pyrophosphorylase family protein